jgi:catechol 2,3-dioxygenase-like lactoylglutathione lyase family enzyme
MTLLRVDELDHVAIRVRDIATSAQWYQEIFGLERRYDDTADDGPLMIGTGAATLALFQTSETLSDSERRLSHIGFRTDRAGFDAGRTALHERGIDAEFSDHGFCVSVYFHDPDDYVIELTTYDV